MLGAQGQPAKGEHPVRIGLCRPNNIRGGDLGTDRDAATLGKDTRFPLRRIQRVSCSKSTSHNCSQVLEDLDAGGNHSSGNRWVDHCPPLKIPEPSNKPLCQNNQTSSCISLTLLSKTPLRYLVRECNILNLYKCSQSVFSCSRYFNLMAKQQQVPLFTQIVHSMRIWSLPGPQLR